MTKIYFITHPEVVVDPKVPIPQWDLSEIGRSRLSSLLRQVWMRNIGVVYSSSETKSVSAGKTIAQHVRIEHITMEDLGEVDRSSTGFLEKVEHDQAVAQLFQNPETSFRGWERAVDAQERIIRAVEAIDTDVDDGSTVAIVSHGGVGTLLMCHVKEVPIARDEAGPGQGNYFCIRRGTWKLVHGWQPIDHA